MSYNFIEKYKMPIPICDEVLNYFNTYKHNAETGYVGSIKNKDTSIKESLDLFVSVNEQRLIEDYFFMLHGFTKLYIEKYRELSGNTGTLGPYTISENTNIQKYKKGQGFKKIHIERDRKITSTREFAFMTYLTNTPNGGTNFPIQDITCECIKGDTIIWPAGFTHPHVGVITNEHEKMIITGWINYE